MRCHHFVCVHTCRATCVDSVFFPSRVVGLTFVFPVEVAECFDAVIFLILQAGGGYTVSVYGFYVSALRVQFASK